MESRYSFAGYRNFTTGSEPYKQCQQTPMQKWFLNGSYKPKKVKFCIILNVWTVRILGKYNSEYDNFVFNFNVNVNESSMKEFCNLNKFKGLINELTYFKNPGKPTCIDLILTNRPAYFQLSTVLETGLSDFHLLIVTEFKIGFTQS